MTVEIDAIRRAYDLAEKHGRADEATYSHEAVGALLGAIDAAKGDTESVLWRVVQNLNLLRVSTDLFTGAMHRYEDRAKEERNEIARTLDLARRIDIRLGVALNDHGKGDTIRLGEADSIFVGNEAGEGINFGFPAGIYRAWVARPGEAVVIERQYDPLPGRAYRDTATERALEDRALHPSSALPGPNPALRKKEGQ